MGRMHKSTAINQLMLEIEGWYGEGGGRRVQDGEHMRNKGIKKKNKQKQSLPILWMYREMVGGNLGPKVRQ